MVKKIENSLLEVLVCPVGGDKLEYDEQNNELVSKKSGLAYPIRNGIPVMLPDEARKSLNSSFLRGGGSFSD